ncbi:MAG: dicarboxylate/amino acid:cation symporter, partial [Acinetobacter sp.]
PIDRLLDTVRTVVNVQGDMMISVVVDRHTQDLDAPLPNLSNPS